MKTKNIKNEPRKIAFFGTPDFAVWVLDGLKEKGIVPDLIITAPDAPKGRKLIMTPPPAKIWAEQHHIPILQPQSVKGADFETELRNKGDWDLFIVAAYGKLIPENILYLPRQKTINVHPSLLPLLRGAAPLHATIMNDMRDTGTTIIRLDKEMDHGPILAQKKLSLASWPIDIETLGKETAKLGATLIAEILPSLLDGTTAEQEQDHTRATFTKKISKEDGLIDLKADGYKNFLKFNANKGWPGSYFFIEKNNHGTMSKIRVTITSASLKEGIFTIEKVIPEGKKEMSWQDFNRGA